MANERKYNHMKLLTLILVAISIIACQGPKQGVHLKMRTSKGDMTIKLYDETPLHRDNFIELAEQGFYDSLLFHRVINEFMIQGGDPDSKNAAYGTMLGNGGPGYTVEAEFDFPKLFHKKGALAAARTGDKINPEKRSSGSQFYIVQGKTFNDEQFIAVEDRLKSMKRKGIFYKILEQYKDSLNIYREAGNQAAIMDLQIKIDEIVEKKMATLPPVSIPDSLKNIYRTIGGVPHLDNNYTVFGEVIEGLEIIDSIAGSETDENDRPKEDIYILEVKVL